MKTPQIIAEEFERLTDPEQFEHNGEWHSLVGESLLDPTWYPESEYELDRDKIKDFLVNALSQQEAELLGLIQSWAKGDAKRDFGYEQKACLNRLQAFLHSLREKHE